MLPHDRVEYQQQMGHVWLGFSEKTMKKYLEGAGFEKRVDHARCPRMRPPRARVCLSQPQETLIER